MKNLVLVILIFLMPACGSEKQSVDVRNNNPGDDVKTHIQVTREQIELANITTGSFNKQVFHTIINANGILEVPPENKASVSAYFQGYVKDFSLLQGQKVRKGQTLFTLENPDYIVIQKEFLEAREELSFFSSEYQRQQNLVKDQITSQKNFTKSETEYKVKKARYESLKKQLEMMLLAPEGLTSGSITSTIRVISPIDGYLSDVNITKGVYLNPSDIALTIVNMDHLHLELSIFEKDLKYLKTGQSVFFSLLNDKENEYEAEVYLIGKSIDPENRTIDVHADLKDEENIQSFAVGMYIEARILTDRQELQSLPNEAVVEIDGTHYGLLKAKEMEDKVIFRKVKLEIGKQDANNSQILNYSEFPENPVFMTTGAFHLITD